MKSILLALLVSLPVFAGAQTTTCDATFAQANLCAQIHWSVGPSSDTENRFEMQFYSLSTMTPADLSAPVAVSLFMPSMGHGSSPVQVAKTAPGAYAVTKVHFIMPGFWEIRISVPGAEMQAVRVDVP